MLQLKRTPFHERTSALSLAQNWRRWAGHIVLGSGLQKQFRGISRRRPCRRQ